MKVSVELGEDVLRVVDELAIRSGRPRDEIIAEAVRQQAVRQQTASAMLADLLVGCDEGLSDDDAESIVEAERNAMRAERRRDRQQGRPVAP